MHSTPDYVSPMQFEQDWSSAQMKIAAGKLAAIKAGRGNDGLWKVRKTIVLFSALPTDLGNR
jgi:hypothetical protein